MEWKKRFVYLKSVVFDEENLGQKGAKFQIVKFPSGSRIGPHYHKKIREVFFVKSGKGTFIFNGEASKAKEGDVFLCEPNDVHEVINNSTEEFVFLIFKTNEMEGDIFWVNDEDKKFKS